MDHRTKQNLAIKLELRVGRAYCTRRTELLRVYIYLVFPIDSSYSGIPGIPSKSLGTTLLYHQK